MLDAIGTRTLLLFSLFRRQRAAATPSSDNEGNRMLAVQKQWQEGNDPEFPSEDGTPYPVNALVVPEWVGAKKEVIDASVGSNGYMPPAPITRRLGEIAEAKLAHYDSHLPSDTFIRQAENYLIKQGIIKKGTQIGFSPYEEADCHLMIGNGTTALFSALMRTLIKTPGDVILSTAPTYGLFMEPILDARGKIEFLFLNEGNNYKPTPEALIERVTAINTALRKEYLLTIQFLKTLSPFGKEMLSEIEKALENNRTSFEVIDRLSESYNALLKQGNTPEAYERLKVTLCPRVRGYFHINPHMPLGNVLTQEDVNGLAEILVSTPDIVVIDDLSYFDLILRSCDKVAGTFAKSNLKSRVVTLYGASKQYALPGVRAGIALGPREIILELSDSVFRTQSMNNVYSVEALQGIFKLPETFKKQYLDEINQEYVLYRDLAIALIEGIRAVPISNHKQIKRILKENKADPNMLKGIPGLSILTVPEAGFFLLIDFSTYKNRYLGHSLLKTSMDFYDAFRYLANLVTLPGELMCYFEKPVLRFSFSLESKQIIEAASRMQKLLASCQSRPLLIQYVRRGEVNDQETEVPTKRKRLT